MMRLFYNTILLLFLTVCFNKLNAQNHIPKTGYSQALIQGNSTILPGTGKLNYTIPLLNIQSKGINLPVTLIYNGGGIKVTDKASWVGHGWSLDVGGAVEREVNGYPDDISNTGWDNESSTRYGTIGYLYQDIDYNSVPAPVTDYEYSDLIWTAYFYDKQPDSFNYRGLSGLSGSFAIRSNGELAANQDNIANKIINLTMNGDDIQAATNSIKGLRSFKVKDINGITYKFDEPEKTILHDYKSIPDYTYNTGWLLKEVANELGQQIYNFTYSNTSVIDYESYSATSNVSKYYSAYNGSSTNQQEVTFYKEYIDSVTYDEGRIEFIKGGNQRDDLPGHYPLKYIKVYDDSDILLREIEFFQSYSVNWLNSNARLRLDSIKVWEYSANEATQSINFTYNNTQLPTENSSDFDFWGYYNNANNDNLLLERRYLTRPEPRFGSTSYLNDLKLIRQFTFSSDHKPNLMYARAASLEQIDYSSGKSIRFNYELNDYSFIEDTLNAVEGQVEDVKNYPAGTIYENGQPYWAYSIYIPETFIEYAQWVKIKYIDNGCAINQGRFTTYNKGNSDHITIQSGEEKWVFVEPGVSYSFNTDNYPGTAPPPCPAIGAAPVLEILYKKHVVGNPASYRKTAGGLRLKSVITSNNNGENLTQFYDYDLEESDGLKSSGVIVTEPNTFFISGQVYDNEVKPIYTIKSSFNQAGFLRANSVYYTNIEEYTCPSDIAGNCIGNSSQMEIGRILRKYSFTKPPEEALTYPFLPVKENISKRLLLKKEIFKSADNYKVKEITYDYEHLEDQGDRITGKLVTPIQYNTNFDLEYFRQFGYQIFPEATRLLKTKEIDFTSESNSLTSSNEIAYVDDDNLCKLSREEVYEAADGTMTKVERSYSGSFNFEGVAPTDIETVAMKMLIDAGRLTEPIEEIHYIKKSSPGNQYLPISRVRYFYDIGPNGKIILDRKVIKKIQNPGSTTISLTQLNGNSFPHEITDDEFITTYYDYDLDYWPHSIKTEKDEKTSNLVNNKKLLVAKVVGCEANRIRYTSFESTAYNGGWHLDADHIKDPSPNENAVTGNKYYHLANSNGTSSSFNSGVGLSNGAFPKGTYLLNYWYKGTVVSFYSGTANELSVTSFTENGWTYTEKIIKWESDNNHITIQGTGFIDELRLHEIDATMETKGYYPDGKVMYEASASGDVVTYEYDTKNRLEWILDRKRDVIEHHEYQEKAINDENSYNKEIVASVRKEGLSKNDVLNADLSNYDVKKSVSFSDGLGRFRQSIHFRADEAGASDLVQFVEYDPFGRELIKYQPYWALYLSTESDYIQTAEADQADFYANSSSLDPLEQTDSPFAVTEVEASPLQRPIEQGGIGDELQPGTGHSTTMEYGWNDANDAILKWEYDATNKIATASGTFSNDALNKTSRTSPDGNISQVFTDARGRKVAQAVVAEVSQYSNGDYYTSADEHNGKSTTEKTIASYIVYDDFGRVVYEIPARAVETMGSNLSLDPANPSTVFKEQITFYEYDNRGRVTTKQTPGQGITSFVYDPKDRLVMSQDAQQETDHKWSFIKRDTRGRVVLKGEISNSHDRDYHQNLMDLANDYEEHFDVTESGNILGYSNNAYPVISINDLLNVYYFDGYDFSPEFDFTPFGENSAPMEVTRGMATGSKTRILKSNGTLGDWLNTVSYYDTKKRPIQAFTQNHKGGWDQIDTYYTELNQVERTVQHQRYDQNAAVHTFTTRYQYYNASGKLQNIRCKIDNDPELFVSNRHYDRQGHLKDLNLHRRDGTSNYLQRINYLYDVQGKLIFINDPSLVSTSPGSADFDDVFGQQLTYFNLDQELEYDPNTSSYEITPRYDGNISAMLWNAKTPDEDGSTLKQNAYIYEYDDFGQMTGAYYAADDPAFPGEYNQSVGNFNETIEYDLGGNLRKLGRHSNFTHELHGTLMDSLEYTYSNSGYKTSRIEDSAFRDFTPQFKHFTDISQFEEYTYDDAGRTLEDKNRNVRFKYNRIGLPRMVVQNDNPDYSIRYMYDAAGNKLQKENLSPLCPPEGPCPGVAASYDYIGNFVYQNGQLKMIYHPEGVIRPTPTNAENQTDYVYDYFIKDYLGNVRVVLTEEDATYDYKFLATMEEVYRQIEEDNFDNINETAEELPPGYPVDGSVEFNERIAELSEATGTEIGPSIVLPVHRGDKVSLSTKYFYEEVGEGTTYENISLLVNEILMSLATSGAGVLQLNETQLIDIASGGGEYSQAILNLLSNSFDTTDVSRPYSYMIWMLYDNDMKLILEGSGAKRVTNPNELGTLIEEDIPAPNEGYLHCFVSNTGVEPVSYDNFLVSYLRGQTRQINHYYPYGLSIDGLEHSDEYLNKYTSKELQTGEFDPLVSSGLEMFDFHARFYDPQVGHWFVGDPKLQFSNPYLAMGNNPVMYTDPDGEFVFVPLLIAMAYGAAIGAGTSAAIYSVQAGMNGTWNWNDFGKTAAFGAVGGALGGGLGYVGSQIGTFGQSLGYNVLSNVASNSATTAAFGGDLTFGSLAGSVVGGFVGNGIGNFNGVSGGAFKNIGAELAFRAAKGASTGFFGSGVGIAADGMTGNLHSNAGASLWNGTKNGAIAGGTVAGLNIASMGAAYRPERQYGDFGREKPVYRRGTLLTRTFFKGGGVTIGRNLVTNTLNENKSWTIGGRSVSPFEYNSYLRAHETGHYNQQQTMGFAGFYSEWFGQLVKYNFNLSQLYGTYGTVEYDANQYSLKRIGYYFDHGIKYTH